MRRTLIRFTAGAAALAAVAFAFAAPASAQKADPKFDAWLKESRLGPYQKDEVWDEVVAKAKKEGELAVYSSSSTTLKAGEDFAKMYPEIKIKVYDLGSEKTIEKVVREHQAGVFAADVVYTGGTEAMVFDLLPNNRIVNYVPASLADKIPAAYREPLLTHAIEAYTVMYNAETYPSPPIKNIWELTEPQWKSRFAMKSPIGSLSSLMSLAAIVENSDAMAKAYQEYAGKPLQLSKGVENAGYEFLKRLLANDVVFYDNSSKLANASGTRGQAKPPISFSVMHYMTRNETDKLANAIAYDLKPAGLFTYPTFIAIGGRAPHPNAAKLFVAFMMGSKDITPATKFEQPFRQGKSFELLQGMASFYQIGTFSPRTDMPAPPLSEAWPKAPKLGASAEFVRDNVAKISDFWTAESSR